MTDSKEKGYSKKRVQAYMIGNAIVWGGVIFITSLILRGTGYMDKLIPIFGAGASISIVLLGGTLLKEK